MLCCAVLSCSIVSDAMNCILPGSSVHGDAPGKNTGVGCHSRLWGIFPVLGSNPGLPHCKQILYHLSYQGSPRILGWAAYPFSGGSSWPSNQTRVYCIAGEFFTSWATRETQCDQNCVNSLYLENLEGNVPAWNTQASVSWRWDPALGLPETLALSSSLSVGLRCAHLEPCSQNLSYQKL